MLLLERKQFSVELWWKKNRFRGYCCVIAFKHDKTASVALVGVVRRKYKLLCDTWFRDAYFCAWLWGKLFGVMMRIKQDWNKKNVFYHSEKSNTICSNHNNNNYFWSVIWRAISSLFMSSIFLYFSFRPFSKCSFCLVFCHFYCMTSVAHFLEFIIPVMPDFGIFL